MALKSYGVAARVHAAQLHLQDLERNVAFYEEQEQEAVLSRNYDLAEESKEQVAQLMQRYHDLQAQVRCSPLLHQEPLLAHLDVGVALSHCGAQWRSEVGTLTPDAVAGLLVLEL